MRVIEILVITIAIVFVALVVVNSFRKKKKGECTSCSSCTKECPLKNIELDELKEQLRKGIYE